MTSIKNKNLNHFILTAPSGVVLTTQWLKEQGISSKLAWWYVHSKWLERVGDGAYKKAGDQVSWVGALAALQKQLNLPIHIGAKTALQFLGQAHFLPMQNLEEVILFTNPKIKIPSWFINNELELIKFNIYQTALFPLGSTSCGLIKRTIENIDLIISAPELALIEMLYLVPKSQSFDEANALMEMAFQLRPKVVQTLLEQCNSIKVKRLFLYFADKFQHPWLSDLDLNKISLGSGKRMIEKGGHYDPKYQISIPNITDK